MIQDTDAEGEIIDPGNGSGEETNNFTYNLNNY